jgi:sentrin-specific protease 1
VFNLCLEFTLQIFVPVHQRVHWCLAIINMKAKTLQYLDSLGGNDPRVPEMLVSLSDLARKTIQLEMHSTFSILYMFFFT